MIGIIGAMEVEVNTIIARMENTTTKKIGLGVYTSGKLLGQDAVVVQCGIGKVNAAVCTTAMIMNYHPDLIVNTGVGGALNPGLHVMDLVIAEKFVQHDMDTSPIGDPVGFVSTVNKIFFDADPALVERLKAAAEKAGARCCLTGIDATADQFVCDPAVKQKIIERFGGDVCDMEGCSIAQVCGILDTPCAAVRAISDGANDDAPMSYPEFAAKAAELSAQVIFHFVESFNAGCTEI